MSDPHNNFPASESPSAESSSQPLEDNLSGASRSVVNVSGAEASGADFSDPSRQERQPRSFFGRRLSLKSPSEALQPETAPQPPEKKKKRRREGPLSAISGFLTFALVAGFVLFFGFLELNRTMREPGPLEADKVVMIAPGLEVPQIVELLETEGVIDNPTLFNIDLLLHNARSKLKAGEYSFKKQASLREVEDTLVSGRQVLHSVTIPEGLTSAQVAERLREVDFLSGDIKEIPREGTLLPDTYRVNRGMARSQLIVKMQLEQKKQLEQIWARRSPDVKLNSPLEMLTLASIVEKETGKADERSRVAAVFANRLQKRMRLQSDPTIVYGLVGGKGTLGRGILRSEIEKWTPYNTYQIDGLPPGPIANPGRAALEAVANPSRTGDLYFVADGTGGHVFAETLDQHNRNVAHWRQVEKERGAAATDRAMPSSDPPSAPVNGTSNPPTNGRRGALATPIVAASELEPKPSWDLSLSTSFNPAALDRLGPEMPSREMILALAKPLNEPIAPPQSKSKLTIATEFPKLDVKIFGVDNDAGDFSADLEGGEGSEATYPVNPKVLADQRARAARLGLNPILDGPSTMPGERSASEKEEEEKISKEVLAYVQQNQGQPPRPRAFDASEGTPLDPLRNKTWDLNSPKTIPASLNAR